MKKYSFILSSFSSILYIFLLRILFVLIQSFLMDSYNNLNRLNYYILNFIILFCGICVLYFFSKILKNIFQKDCFFCFDINSFNIKKHIIPIFLVTMIFLCLPTIMEISSPLYLYWILNKYFPNNLKLREMFFNYPSVRKNACVLFVIEICIILIFSFIVKSIAAIVFIFFFFFVPVSSFLWYLPFLLLSYVNKVRTKSSR